MRKYRKKKQETAEKCQVCCIFESDEHRNEQYIVCSHTSKVWMRLKQVGTDLLTSSCTAVVTETNRGGTHDCGLPKDDGSHVIDSLLLFSSCHPSPCLPYTVENKCVTQKTAIKLTSCSLSDPLIKGRYPVYGSSFELSGVSPIIAMHHPDTGGVVTRARRDGRARTLLRFLWRVPTLLFLLFLLSRHPSQTKKPSHTVKPEDASQASIARLL